MKKLLMIMLAFGMVALLAMPALAEVQNIKVSGGMNVYGVMRDQIGINAVVDGSGGGRDVSNVDAVTFAEQGDTHHYMTSAYFQLDADMTDNVAATMKMGAERDWGAGAAGDQNIEIWTGYITLKEFLYSPNNRLSAIVDPVGGNPQVFVAENDRVRQVPVRVLLSKADKLSRSHDLYLNRVERTAIQVQIL